MMVAIKHTYSTSVLVLCRSLNSGVIVSLILLLIFVVILIIQ